VVVTNWTDLKKASEAVHSGSSLNITLTTNFYCDYSSEIKIGGKVAIYARGAICDAAGEGRFFLVVEGGSLMLESMVLNNGGSPRSVCVLLLCVAGCGKLKTILFFRVEGASPAEGPSPAVVTS
jgi:hypothetical protein